MPAAQAPDIDAELERVIELRAEDRVGAALERVRALERAFPDAPPWFRGDLASLVATLTRLSEAEPGDRLREGMAEAHRRGLAYEAALAEGDRSAAVRELRAALALCEEHLGPLDRETLWRRVDLAWTLGTLQDAAGSKAAASAALERAREAGLDAHPLPASARTALAYAELKRGNTAAAREAFLAASAIWDGLPRDFPRLRVQRVIPIAGLATLENSEGNHAVADGHFAEAVALTRVDPGVGSSSWASLMNNIGTALLERGEPLLAEPFLRRALVAKKALYPAGHPSLLNSLSNVATLLLSTGDFASAEELVRDALPAPEDAGGVALQVGALLETLAQAELARGDLEAARGFATSAVELSRGAFADQPLKLRAAFELLIQVEISRGALDAAEALLGELDALADEGSAGSLAARSRLALLRGEAEDADALAEEALGQLASDAPEPFRAALLAHQARATLALAELERAEELFLEAAELQDLLRLRVGPGLARAAFGGTGQWSELAGVRAALDDPEGAWEARERGSGRVLLELLAGPRGGGDAVEPDALEDIAGVMGADEALIGWLAGPDDLGERGLWAWTLRADGEPTWTFSSGDPAQALRAFRDALADGALAAFPPAADAEAEAQRALYDALFAPIEAELDGVTRLVAVPAAPVLGVPLEALVDASGRTVDERFTVSYAPSGSVLARLRARGASPDKKPRALAIGDPPFRPEHVSAADAASTDPSARRSSAFERPLRPGALPRLPASRREAQAVAALFPDATTLIGAAASERALAELDLASYTVLHFATHALVDDERPDRSALVLSQVDLPDPLETALVRGRIDDGLLTAGDITRGPRLSAELVTLSACDTALGRPMPGEGYLGLADAFLQAGARAVVASLWAVDDAATARFMGEFYAAWNDGASRAEALRVARAALRADPQTAHPGTWSAFVLFGDGR